jgi:transposase
MIIIRLTGAQINDIADALDDPEFPERAKPKLLAVRMHHEGGERAFICKVLRISPNTLTNYLKAYRDGGIAALAENRYYRPLSSVAPYSECVACSFKVDPPADANEAVARIAEITGGIVLSASQARRVMKEMGMSLRRCAAVPGKADPQLQFDFYQKELKPRLEEASRGERKLFFADAAHFVLGAFLGMVWCFTRLFLKSPSGRQRYNVLGAIDSHSKELISVRSTENTDAGTVSELFYQIRKRYPYDPVTVVMDNARYQRCKFAQKAADDYQIEILFLPAYSPNLNLIERLWKLVRKRSLTNRYFDCFAKFVAALDGCLDAVNDELREEVESLLTLKFQFFAKHKT